jgi:Phytanoyl-CoA dioxygenase (PhyH)
MSSRLFTPEQLVQYERDGYLLVAGMFSSEEIGFLGEVARADESLNQGSHAAKDGEGGAIKLALWNEESDDIYGMFSRSRRIVDNVELILDEEIYHYHSKMIQKEPLTGGAWEWHQDYGYWYDFGILFPRLVSCFIAVDRATRANGCLQVLKGSQHLGRMNHQVVGDQTGADPERVEQACKQLELVHCEMEAGDALFFHSNLLHRSDQNKSKDPRWSFICCYNAASNRPYKESRHADYHPLEKVEDEAIREFGNRIVPKEYFDPKRAAAATMKE